MNESTPVKVALADGAIIELSLVISTGERCSLSLEQGATPVATGHGTDLFEALRALRRALEGRGMRLLCAGARADVHPSGMSRSMSGGRKAYVLRMGSPGQASDLVDVLAYAPPDQVGTVDQQDEHYKAWVASLRAKLEEVPLPGEIEEAKQHPNGWVYRIAPGFKRDAAVPPDAIVGAWKVGPRGVIEGTFRKNEKYDAAKWARKRS